MSDWTIHPAAIARHVEGGAEDRGNLAHFSVADAFT
jgi:hypothetical protein